jgi:subtilase family serine protease
VRGSIQPGRLTRSRRASLLAAGLLLGVVSVAGCTGSSGATGRGAAVPAGAVSGCLLPPAYCYAPHVFRVAYGIQPLLDRGIDGRGKTVTILVAAPSPHAPAGPDDTGIRQDLAAFDRMFGLPAARIQIVTALAGAASPGQASFEEVMDLEIVHMVAPAAALRVVLMPANVMESAATGTADMIAALRLAVSSTDVTSISWIAGEHFSLGLRWPRCTPYCWGRPPATSRWTPVPATPARPVPLCGAARSRRSAFRPPTRSCWPWAAPR